MVESQWVAERRGLVRFRSEQPNCSILDRGIEAEVPSVAERYGIGVLVWSPLAKGMLTGRARKGQQTDLRRAGRISSLSDERRLDAVERLVPLAEEAGVPMTHLAMAFAIAHPTVSSALIGPRTMEQLEDLLASVDVTLSDELPRPDRRNRAARHGRWHTGRGRISAPGPHPNRVAPTPER